MSQHIVCEKINIEKFFYQIRQIFDYLEILFSIIEISMYELETQRIASILL